ncbi:MAG: hypothetical protein QW470_04080 [Candidatus Caldarchaeum sp.]
MEATTLLDSTLREGELFRVLKTDAKVELVRKLAEVGIKRIELTVDYPPRTTRDDVEPVVRAVNECGLEAVLHGRALKQDVEAAAKYDPHGLAVYISPTEIHRVHKLHGITYEEAVGRLAEAVTLARSHGFRYVRATLEDASRFYVEGELEKLVSAIKRLDEAGVSLVSVPDTAGLLSPRTSAEFIRRLRQSVSTPLAAHFHNDYGMASPNTVEAILEGVAEAHVTVMGVGDRNGIADLYEVVATLEDIHGVQLGMDRSKIQSLYGFFGKVAGIRLHWRHPLSDEAKTLRAGVHQAMAVEKPEGYIPKKKLETDFGNPVFHIGVYTSHRLVAMLAGLDPGDPQVKKATEVLAKKARERRNGLNYMDLKEVLKKELGVDVTPETFERFVKRERAYLLAKLDPQYDVDKILRELAAWDDVESVDEVYGDVDVVVVGRLSLLKDNFVERFRTMFADGIEDLKVLVAD